MKWTVHHYTAKAPPHKGRGRPPKLKSLSVEVRVPEKIDEGARNAFLEVLAEMILDDAEWEITHPEEAKKRDLERKEYEKKHPKWTVENKETWVEDGNESGGDRK